MKTYERISTRKGFGMKMHNGTRVILFVSLLVFSGSMGLPTKTGNIITEGNAGSFLTRYGYLKEPELDTRGGFAGIQDMDVLEKAIKDFQDFASINVTGKIDKDTLKLMNTPRCGLRDKKPSNSLSNLRQKRYVIQGSRWKIKNLTYRITKYPAELSKSSTDEEIQRAFNEWSKVTQLTFAQKSLGKTNIEIRFEVGNHDDGDPFDGAGQTLAHAFFPESGGDVHFDDEETWTIRSRRGTNLFQVAVHEIGHSLGLEHSKVRSALMYPFYRGYVPDFELDDDDINGIQELYGQPNKYVPSVTEEPRVKNRIYPKIPEIHPDLCADGKIDAIFESADGSVYVFKGASYWRLSDEGVEVGYPKLISDTWTELPRDIDTAFTSTNGRTYFFKGSKYWKYSGRILEDGYPKDISIGFAEIPKNIDAAMWWKPSRKAYFFKGSKFWVYDPNSNPQVSSTYPKSISDLKGIPNDLDDVLFTNNRLYFFKDGKYYRFNDTTHQVADATPPYPRSAKRWWFGCERTNDSAN